jgi:hypothetical protein
MQKTITINIQKLLKQIAEINNLAKEKNWKYSYDSQLDSLYFSPSKIQPHYSLFSINDELSVYVDRDSNIGGVFIEYYKSNLTSHDEKYKTFANLFTNRRQLPKNKRAKETLLSEVIKAELLADLVKTEKNSIKIPVAYL